MNKKFETIKLTHLLLNKQRWNPKAPKEEIAFDSVWAKRYVHSDYVQPIRGFIRVVCNGYFELSAIPTFDIWVDMVSRTEDPRPSEKMMIDKVILQAKHRSQYDIGAELGTRIFERHAYNTRGSKEKS